MGLLSSWCEIGSRRRPALPAQEEEHMSREHVYREMTELLGVVPTFFSNVSEKSLELEWELFKLVELQEGTIPGKYRELVGLAVSSVTGCSHAIHFHKQAAKFKGATDAEIEDALHFAMSAAGMSAYFEGIGMSDETHERDVLESIRRRAENPHAGWGSQDLPNDASRDEVYKAIEGAIWLVPTPFQCMSKAALPLEWKLNQLLWYGKGDLHPKHRHLIGVGLGAAIRNRKSVFLHTQMAKAFGASDAEIEEAAYMAKISVSWAVYINGQEADLEQFSSEIAAGIDHMTVREAAPST